MKEFLLSHNSYQVRILQEQNSNLWICVHDILMIIKRPSMQSTFPLFKICPSYCKMQFKEFSLYFIQLRDVKPLLNQVKNESKAINVTCTKLQEWVNYLPSTVKEFCGEKITYSPTPVGLVNIIEKDGVQAVDARDLHAFLKSKQEFTSWIKNKIEKFDFVENQDFEVFDNFIKNPNGGRPRKDYIISINMAKELSMIEGNEQGKKARRYFIECEKQLVTLSKPSYQIENPIKRAQKWIEEQKEKETLLLEQSENKPKVEYANLMVKNKQGFTTAQIAIELGVSSLLLMNKLKKYGVIDYKNKQMVPTSGYKNWRILINGNYRWTKEARTKILSLFQSKISI